MSEHLAESQPKHHDAGMDALIRHLESGPAEPAPAEEPAEGDAEPVEAEGEQVDEQESLEAVEEQQEQVEELEDPLIPVKANGVEEQVPLSELVNGYERRADYTRKTQALGRERNALEAERSQLMLAQREAVERTASLANQLQAQLQSQQVNQAEMDALRVSDPGEWAARQADQQRKSQMLYQAQQQVAAYEQQQNAVRAEASKQALMEANDEFRNDFSGTYERVGRYITSPDGGRVPVENWNSEFEASNILVAWKAMKYDEQGAATSSQNSSVRRKVANLPRIRSAARQESGQTERDNYAAAEKQMKATNTTRDTARALEAFMAQSKARRGGNGYP